MRYHTITLLTHTFNEGYYDASIGYCEVFLILKVIQKKESGPFSLKQLEPQEQSALYLIAILKVWLILQSSFAH